MKYKNQKYLQNIVGETRIKKKFLWLPKHFRKSKTKWLEWAYIKEQVIYHTKFYGPDLSDLSFESAEMKFVYNWAEIDFVSKEEFSLSKGQNK